MTVISAIILLVVIILGFLLYKTFAWGYVVHKAYYWLLMPLFDTLPDLTFMQVSMVMLIWFGIRGSNSSSEDKQEAAIGEFIAPWVFLFITWFFSIFV